MDQVGVSDKQQLNVSQPTGKKTPSARSPAGMGGLNDEGGSLRYSLSDTTYANARRGWNQAVSKMALLSTHL